MGSARTAATIWETTTARVLTTLAPRMRYSMTVPRCTANVSPNRGCEYNTRLAITVYRTASRVVPDESHLKRAAVDARTKKIATA
jgi:hypothetical protein